MAFTFLKSDSVVLKQLSDGSRLSGLDVWLLPDGGTAPGDLIQLTENGTHSGQYDFPAGVTSGKYRLYVGTAGAQTPVSINSQAVYVMVARSGLISAENTDFAESWS